MNSCGDKKQQKEGVSQNPNEIKAIKEILNAQKECWNNGDIDGFMLGYWHSDSLKFIGRNGVKYGYDTISNNYKKHYPDKETMGFLSFKNIQSTYIDSTSQVAQVNGKWQITGRDSAGGFFSLILKPINGDWRIVIDHTW